MSDVKAAKDALVASLFELSKAALDAATATVNFYKANDSDDKVAINSLNNLAQTINALIPDVTGKIDGKIVDKKPEKKKKAEKDPNAPKKPLTMYFAYSFHIRDQIRDERKAKGLPPLSAIEMNSHVKDRWSQLGDDEKSKWQKKYQDELKEYNVQKEAYQAKLEGNKANIAQPKLAEVDESSSASDSDDSSEEETKKQKVEKKRKKDSKHEKKKKSKK